ncbi:MAG: sigma-70 family RNA polymerase sigma factor [Planctomycetes bacterium]|nr:sigma-70 family RNA polymerase sigma factor [Planctomycetota bacterium]
MQSLSDKELVMMTLNGKRECFGGLVTRYYSLIYSFIYKRISQKNNVEDLAQEVFTEAYGSLKTCREPDKFQYWLFGIASNRIGKWARSIKYIAVEPSQIDTKPDDIVLPEQIISDKELFDKIESEVVKLSPQAKEILRLKHKEGKSCVEIASILNCPVGTITSQLSRTYKQLRRNLEGQLGDYL